jgi:hypothetical protein
MFCRGFRRRTGLTGLAAYEKAFGAQHQGNRVARRECDGTICADVRRILPATQQRGLCQQRPGTPIGRILAETLRAVPLGGSQIACGERTTRRVDRSGAPLERSIHANAPMLRQLI